jgi:uncharacterized protein
MTILTLRPTPSRLVEPPDAPERYYQASPGRQLVADPARRRRVDFVSDGVRLAGHLYRPPRAVDAEPTPAIVMCGPASSVKEQTLPHYAERFADAGYTVLTFDPRTFGESDGQPRCYYDPAQVISDYANAVSYLLTRDDVDPDRVALVGVCMGGGYAISVAARDRRVAAVVSVAGGFDIGGTFLANLGAEGFAGFMRQINDLATREYETGQVQYLPAIAPDLSNGLAFMPNPEAFSYYDRTSRTDAPTWEKPRRRQVAAGLLRLQRRRRRSAGRADAAADRARDRGSVPVAGVRPTRLRRRQRGQGTRLDPDPQPHRALRPAPLRRPGHHPRRGVAGGAHGQAARCLTEPVPRLGDKSWTSTRLARASAPP